jgi:L-lysine exporter family protein LysE/ArgO
LALFASGFLLSLSLCMDLGIVNVSIMKTGIEQGIFRSFLVGLGSCFGDLLYAVLAAAGVSWLIERSAALRWMLWLGGTAVLVYLTVSMAKAALRPKPLSVSAAWGSGGGSGRLRPFLQGLALSVASPTSFLWFASMGGSVIAASIGHEEGRLAPFFAGFFTASAAWSLFIAVLSGLGGRAMGERMVRMFSLVSALLFLGFAVRVFWDGLQRLI